MTIACSIANITQRLLVTDIVVPGYFCRDLCTRQLLLKWHHVTMACRQPLKPGNWQSVLFTSIRTPVFVPDSNGRPILETKLVGLSPFFVCVCVFFGHWRISHSPIDFCQCCFLWKHSGSYYFQPNQRHSFKTGCCNTVKSALFFFFKKKLEWHRSLNNDRNHLIVLNLRSHATKEENKNKNKKSNHKWTIIFWWWKRTNHSLKQFCSL